MRTLAEWNREKEIFSLTDQELIERVQIESYNNGVKDTIKTATLLSSSGRGTEHLGKKYEIYSPSFGMKTITIDEKPLLALIKQE